MKELWIKNCEQPIEKIGSGVTLLLKLSDLSKGITAEGGFTVDISWVRMGGKVIATDGRYNYDDVLEYQIIK